MHFIDNTEFGTPDSGIIIDSLSLNNNMEKNPFKYKSKEEFTENKISHYPELQQLENGALVFPVRSLGWCEISESDLTPERSSKAVNKCIMDLSYGKNGLDSMGKWGEGQNLQLVIDTHDIQIKNMEGKLITVQPIKTIKVWGVGKENGREKDFAYVVRDNVGSLLEPDGVNNRKFDMSPGNHVHKLTSSLTMGNLSCNKEHALTLARRFQRFSLAESPTKGDRLSLTSQQMGKRAPGKNKRYICYVFRCEQQVNAHRNGHCNTQYNTINGISNQSIANTLKAACKRLMIERSSEQSLNKQGDNFFNQFSANNPGSSNPMFSSMIQTSQEGYNDFNGICQNENDLGKMKLNKSISFNLCPNEGSQFYGLGNVMDDDSYRNNRPHNLSLQNNRPHISPIISPIDVGFLDTMDCFPTPIEEPYRILKALYIGELKVDKPSGMDVLNEAIDKLYNEVPQSAWALVRVKISPSCITVHDYKLPMDAEPLAKCRVRYLSFLGISKTDVKNCGFIMSGIWAPSLRKSRTLSPNAFRKTASPSPELSDQQKRIASTYDSNFESDFGSEESENEILSKGDYMDGVKKKTDLVTEKFLCQVFRSEPTSAALCKTIEAACRLRYQKCLDSNRNREAVQRLQASISSLNSDDFSNFGSFRSALHAKNLNLSLNGGVKSLSDTLRSMWSSITWKHPNMTP